MPTDDAVNCIVEPKQDNQNNWSVNLKKQENKGICNLKVNTQSQY